MKTERLNVVRVIPILVIIVSTITLSCILAVAKELYSDEVICVSFLDMLFLLIFIYELAYSRTHRLIANNIATTFSRIAVGYVVCCVYSVLFLFCPNYFMPVMLTAVLMCALGNELIAIAVGTYLCVIYSVICNFESFEVISYIFMILFAGGLAKSLTEQVYRKYICLIMGFIQMIVPYIFYYLSYGKLNIAIYAYGVINAFIVILFSYFVFPVLRKDTEAEIENQLWDILSDDFAENKRIKQYFPADYEHAQKVSDIAIRCGRMLGLNVGLCGAGGFYYRMGKWTGENYVEAGVEKAQLLNFPVELIRILSEYNGELHKPSSPESALIHMVDSLVIKMQALNPGVAKSTWNHEMIIYQTLNEFSSSGIYDESGLSMNQFLNIREFLVKEEMLR